MKEALAPDLADSRWDLIPLKMVAGYEVSNVDKHSHDEEEPVQLCNYSDVYNNEFISPALDLMRATATASEIEKFHLHVGDVIITKDSESWDDIGVPAVVETTEDDLVCGYHLAMIRADASQCDGRFLFRCLQAQGVAVQLEIEAKGVTRFGLPKDAIGATRIPLPPLSTQRRIAAYLDRETARIDALVAEKEKMLSLLAEKRAALVARAVTRGLDPDAPTKPSGLDWLGEIPEHWEVRRAGSLFTEHDVRGEPELPLLNVSLNTGVTVRVFSEDQIEGVAADFNSYKVARQGQLVFNKMRFWQGAGGIAPSDGLTSPDYTVASFTTDFEAGYVENLVRLSQFSREVRRHSYGMVDDRLRLYWDGFKNIKLPLPPLAEQRAIVARLEAERARTAELEEALRRSLTLARERRAALITAAVTGQLNSAILDQ